MANNKGNNNPIVAQLLDKVLNKKPMNELDKLKLQEVERESNSKDKQTKK
jgi:hypothetical protein